MGNYASKKKEEAIHLGVIQSPKLNKIKMKNSS
jgi:hypothetical protein